jgi:predicted XRE-type DNA-binding protein
MKVRAELMMAIRETVDGWKLTQAEAARRLGVTQPRMSDLVLGRIDKFSLDALVEPCIARRPCGARRRYPTRGLIDLASPSPPGSRP